MKITIEINSIDELLALKPLIKSLEPPTDGDGFPRLSSLNLSTRTMGCLANEDIDSVAKLIDRTANELLKTPNLGRKALNEIKEELAAHGLRLKGDM